MRVGMRTYKTCTRSKLFFECKKIMATSDQCSRSNEHDQHLPRVDRHFFKFRSNSKVILAAVIFHGRTHMCTANDMNLETEEDGRLEWTNVDSATNKQTMFEPSNDISI